MDFNIVYKNLKNAINTTSITGNLAEKIDGITDIGLTFSSLDETTWNNLINTPGTVLNEGQYVIASVDTYLKLVEASISVGVVTSIYSNVETYLKLAEAAGGPPTFVYPNVFGIELDQPTTQALGIDYQPIKTGDGLLNTSLKKMINSLENEYGEVIDRILDKGVVEGGRKSQTKCIDGTVSDLWTAGIPGVLPAGTPVPQFIQDFTFEPGDSIEISAQNYADFSILPRFNKDFSISEETLGRLIDKGIVINYYSLIGQNGERAQKYRIYNVDSYIAWAQASAFL